MAALAKPTAEALKTNSPVAVETGYGEDLQLNVELRSEKARVALCCPEHHGSFFEGGSVLVSSRLVSSRALMLCLVVAAGCEGDRAIDDESTWRAGDADEPDEQVEYETVVRYAANGDVIQAKEHGEWTPDLAERVARPWLHLAEGLVHNAEAWYIEHPDGTVESGYRVAAARVEPVDTVTPPAVEPLSAEFAVALSDLDDDATIDVVVELAGWSPAPLPWVPHRTTVSADDYVAYVGAMREAAAATQTDFQAAAADLAEAIELSGGQVISHLSSYGSVVATVPAVFVTELSERPDVRRIMPDSHGESGSHVVGDPVPLNDLRVFTGAQAYHDAGFKGQSCGLLCATPGLTLGVLEVNGYEAEACFMGLDECTSAQRVRRLFGCTSSQCTEMPNGYAGTAYEEEHHGTFVTSIAVGDYLNGQADQLAGWIAPGLGQGWKDRASGFGPWARLAYFAHGGAESRKAIAYDCARGIGSSACSFIVDVTNQSSGDTNGWCNARSWLPLEGALENVWDAGVLPVVATMNDNYYPTNDECYVRSPADVPKAFAVGALEPSDTLPYHSWPIVYYSNRGGGLSRWWHPIGQWINSSTAMSMVDLVASGRPGYVTNASGLFGNVQVDGPHTPDGPVHLDQGTSFAAPQVAGAALLVKSRHQYAGHTWINNPGRLHAMMLAMGDRGTTGSGGATIPSCIAGNRIRCGADRYYGLGRLTLRLHPALWMRTRTFTASSAVKEMPFGPLGSSRRIFKCVMQQREDMVGPDKDHISVVALQIQVRGQDPDNLGTCTVDKGTVYHTVTDQAPDDKHMVTVTDADTQLAGRCVQVNFAPLSVTASVGTHTYCVFDSLLDYDE